MSFESYTANGSDYVSNNSYRNASSNVTVGVLDVLKNSVNDDVISPRTAEQIELVLVCWLFPVITLLGVTGNVLSLVVLLQKRLFNTTVIILLGLAVADAGYLIANFLQELTSIMERFDAAFANWYQVKSFALLFYMKTSFARVSTLLVVAISVERFIAVAVPLKVKLFSTRLKMTVVVFSIYLFTFGILSVFPVQYTTTTINGKHYITLTEFYWKNKRFLDIFNVHATVIVFRWIPKLLVIVFNVLICVLLSKRRRIERHLSISRNGSMQNKYDRRVTKMLVVVALVFVICLLPGDAFIIIAEVVDGFTLYGKYKFSFQALSDISILFAMINSSVNFIIYMVFNKTFSMVYVRLFCPCLRERSMRNTGKTATTMSVLSRSSSTSVVQDISTEHTNI